MQEEVRQAGEIGFSLLPSYWDAISQLERADQAAVWLAIVEYGFTGEISPSLTPLQRAMLTAFRPTIDSSIQYHAKKSAAGKKGAQQKAQKQQAAEQQAESKPDFASKQTEAFAPSASKREGEGESESEGESILVQKASAREGVEELEHQFRQFYQAYPRHQHRAAAWQIWKREKPPLRQCLAAVEAWKQSAQWTKQNGQYIPLPDTWLTNRGWEDELPRAAPAPAAGCSELERQAIARMMGLPLEEAGKR